MYSIKIPLPEGLVLAHLMDAVEKRDSCYPGKSYVAYPVGRATPQKLAAELSAVWHGHGTAMDAMRVLFGGDLPNVAGDLLGTFYLMHILCIPLKDIVDFNIYNSKIHGLGMARQSWLANSGDRDTLKKMWFKNPVDWKRVVEFIPDYKSFWQKYYDVFGGRREDDIRFLVKDEFGAVWKWLWVFTTANPSCGRILSCLRNDVVLIK